jgi:hypothetical protein
MSLIHISVNTEVHAKATLKYWSDTALHAPRQYSSRLIDLNYTGSTLRRGTVVRVLDEYCGFQVRRYRMITEVIMWHFSNSTGKYCNNNLEQNIFS